MFYDAEDCTPTVVGIWQEPSDGEFMTEKIYNCESCDCKTCEHWQMYH